MPMVGKMLSLDFKLIRLDYFYFSPGSQDRKSYGIYLMISILFPFWNCYLIKKIKKNGLHFHYFIYHNLLVSGKKKIVI